MNPEISAKKITLKTKMWAVGTIVMGVLILIFCAHFFSDRILWSDGSEINRTQIKLLMQGLRLLVFVLMPTVGLFLVALSGVLWRAANKLRNCVIE
jgi:hypothetical protein